MTKYINTGAWIITPEGRTRRPQTKKELKQAVDSYSDGGAYQPFFDQTSAYKDAEFGFKIAIEDIPYDVTLSVVGPDPYTSRKWYANVVRTYSGKVVVR